MTCTAPLLVPFASSPVAPTARSGAPSPLRSPTNATDAPKLSLSARPSLPSARSLISRERFTEPSVFISTTCMAPLSVPPASSR